MDLQQIEPGPLFVYAMFVGDTRRLHSLLTAAHDSGWNSFHPLYFPEMRPELDGWVKERGQHADDDSACLIELPTGQCLTWPNGHWQAIIAEVRKAFPEWLAGYRRCEYLLGTLAPIMDRDASVSAHSWRFDALRDLRRLYRWLECGEWVEGNGVAPFAPGDALLLELDRTADFVGPPGDAVLQRVADRTQDIDVALSLKSYEESREHEVEARRRRGGPADGQALGADARSDQVETVEQLTPALAKAWAAYQWAGQQLGEAASYKDRFELILKHGGFDEYERRCLARWEKAARTARKKLGLPSRKAKPGQVRSAVRPGEA